MNWKRLWITSAAVYVVAQVLNFLIHEVWLGPTYGALASVWRPEAELVSKQWIFFVTGAFYCFFFCYIFARGWEGKGWLEGVRYGAVIGLFVGVTSSYDWYVLLPIPYSLALKWFLSGFAASIVLGVVASLVYKPE